MRGGAIQLRLAAADGDHAAPYSFGQRTNIRPMGPSPMTATVSPGADAAFFQAAHHAGQRLDQRRILIAHMRRESRTCCAATMRAGNADVLGVGAVVEQQILAQIFLAALAEEALAAGRRIGRHHALARRGNFVTSLAHRDDVAGQFVPEQGRRHDHPRVVAAAKDLDVGAAGERHA